MYQIAIGDSTSWTVLEGASIAAPFRKAAVFFTFSHELSVREKIEITLTGTPAQVSAALGTLEKVALRAQAYARLEYAQPQLLRFQPASGGSYYYAQISDLYFESSADSYLKHQRGSYLVSLVYSRPNYFDGDQVELALTGRAGDDITGGIDLINHTDFGALDGNTVLIKAADAVADLPSPLRVELLNNYATSTVKDIYFGLYHHPTVDDEDIFFAQAVDMSGGSNYSNAAAIGGVYRRKSWTASSFTNMFTYPISLVDIPMLDGRYYRPLLHLFASHAYDDLYFKLKLYLGSYLLYTGEQVYSDPSYSYVLFPPIQIPPNQLLRENLPHSLDLIIYGLRAGGSAVTIDVDQLCFLPLDYAAFFYGFYEMDEDDKLVYDNFRNLSNVRYSAGQTEAVAHVRHGGPLLLYPNENNRLFVFQSNTSNVIDIARTSVLRVYYRPRVRLL